MTLFFLVVGLEAKRELDLGELRDRKRLALPVVAALGGMIVPIAIYVAFNAGGRGGDGWGAAMSTDTAFALGLLALAAPRGSTRLRVFLLTLAVVDDLCALLVIATAYSEHVSITALAIAIGLFGVLVALRYAPVGRAAAAAVVGTAIWVAMFKSGIHPTIAGLAIGLVTSAYPPARDDLERASETFRSFREQPTPELARTAQLTLVSAISANERLQYRLHPWTSYAIVPLFALANAGITFSGGLLGDALRSPVTLGIVIGYVVGKPAGIVGASWLATRRVFGGQRLPVSWPGLGGDRGGGRDRLHRLAADLDARLPRSAARGGQDRHPGGSGAVSALGMGGLSRHRADPRLHARAPAERHRRGAARPRRRRRPRCRPSPRPP